MLSIPVIRVFLFLLSILPISSLSKNHHSGHARHQHGVGCYKCDSFNGSDEHCGDPFHPAFNMGRYHVKCEQGMDKRIGMFPARYCTKIKGTNLKTNVELIVRSCSLYDFDNTCGLFEYENERYSGCLMSCTRDACNTAQRTTTATVSVAILELVVQTVVVFLGLFVSSGAL